MNQTKELRIDVFLYFIIVFGPMLSTATIVFFTTFFALRLWFPDILAELERVEDDEDEPLPNKDNFHLAPETPSIFHFSDINDLDDSTKLAKTD